MRSGLIDGLVTSELHIYLQNHYATLFQSFLYVLSAVSSNHDFGCVIMYYSNNTFIRCCVFRWRFVDWGASEMSSRIHVAWTK